MKLVNAKLVVVSAVLSLAMGCNNGGSDNKGNGGGGGGIPGDVPLKIDTTYPQLDSTQTQEVKAYMKTDEKKLPGTDLLYEATSDKQKKENQEKVAKLDADGRANYKTMQDNCTVKNKQTKRISGPAEGTMPKAGDVIVTEEYQSITGSGCPVGASNASTVTTTVLDFNYDADKGVLNRYVLKMQATNKMRNEFRSQTFINLNNGRTKMAFDLNLNGQFEVTQQLNSSYFKVTGAGSIDSKNGSALPATIEMESLSRTETTNGVSNKSSSKMVMKMTLKFPSFMLVVQGLQDSSSERNAVQKYFVNGREFSPEEFAAIFGDGFGMNAGGQSLN